MTISYDDFEKVDIRVGKVVEVEDLPKARKPAFKLKIDFGTKIGVKTSSVQAVGAHTKDEMRGMLVVCVINFEPKIIAGFKSEVLTLGFANTSGDGWILIKPAKETVKLGDRLR